MISDLALILVLAAGVTLIFKRLHQPLILGYIVAGIICGPHLSIFPTVTNLQSVETWADIGVVFLMFTLGLEFSFRKLIKMGPSPIVAALTIIISMISLGTLAGHLFGWSQMTSVFLGGMLAMSSTTIIFKALDDMGLRQQRFATSVLGALVVEDILGILLMVALSTMAVSRQFEGAELFHSLSKLAIVLVVWFVIGIFLIPTILRKARPLMSPETLLILSLGLCFLMVVLAVKMGYSAAFGAFMAGSILAETVEAEQINQVVAPVKDLFGAIFFVSVGMLVDPAIIGQYWLPILILTLVIIIGQSTLGTLGFLLSGRSLPEAIQCGFTMTQIGEFAFIIASLGVSLKVTEPFLYPVVVAVSVITTFLTPYMIRLAPHAVSQVARRLPSRYTNALNTQTTVTSALSESTWRRLIVTLLRQTLIYSLIAIALLTLGLYTLLPLLRHYLGHWPGNIVTGLVTFLIMAPFLRAIVMRKNHSQDFRTLWQEKIYNRPPLIFTILLRYLIATAIVFNLINYLSPYPSLLHWVVSLILVGATVLSRNIMATSRFFERIFLSNLESRQRHAQLTGKAAPNYASELKAHDTHLAIVQVPMNSSIAGKTLLQLDLAHRHHIMVAAIARTNQRIHIPGANTVIFPGDRLQIIGSDHDVTAFSQYLASQTYQPTATLDDNDMVLRSITVTDRSPLCGKTVRHSRLREDYACMLVGFDEGNAQLTQPHPDRVIQEGDNLWIVGEKVSMRKLLNENTAQ